MFVGELAMTPRIWLVAVCCSSDFLSSWTRRTFSLAVAVSRCKDWASSLRRSAFVWACLARDAFTAAPPGFCFVFLEPFLVVVDIKKKTETEMLVAGETRSMTGSGYDVAIAPQRLR